MNKLMENMLGVINDGDNWIEILLEDTPPKKSVRGTGNPYVYITKYHRGRNVEERSIGLPLDKAEELGKILLSINSER